MMLNKNRRSCAMLFFILVVVMMAVLINAGIIQKEGALGRRAAHTRPHHNIVRHRRLASHEGTSAENEALNNNEVELPLCSEILIQVTSEQRCNYAKNCEGGFLMTFLLPLVFCTDPSIPSSLDNYPVLEIFFPIL